MNRTRKTLLIVAFSILCAMLLAIGLGFLLFSDLGYCMETLPLKAELKKIPDIEVMQVWGRNEDTTLEHLFARVKPKDKGVITFIDLTKQTFHSVKELRLLEIGPLRFVTEFPSGYGDWIDIGIESPVDDFRDLAITNVSSAIRKYDTIYAIADALPRYPDAKDAVDPQGRRYRISVRIAR